MESSPEILCPTGIVSILCTNGNTEYRWIKDDSQLDICSELKIIPKEKTLVIPFQKYYPKTDPYVPASGFKPSCELLKGVEVAVKRIGPTIHGRRFLELTNEICGTDKVLIRSDIEIYRNGKKQENFSMYPPEISFDDIQKDAAPSVIKGLSHTKIKSVKCHTLRPSSGYLPPWKKKELSPK